MTPTETRELLELAAKAAGYEIKFDGDSRYSQNFAGWQEWNPLTDHGDRYRYRLAWACNMVVDFDNNRVIFAVNGEPRMIYFTPGNDAEEAMAILHAAAEIGRNM